MFFEGEAFIILDGNAIPSTLGINIVNEKKILASLSMN